MAAKTYMRTVAGRIKHFAAVVVSAGAGNDGDLVALDATGKLDTSVMPAGFGAATIGVIASETIANGDFVNIFDASGTANIRKADATNPAKFANGFVPVGGAAAATLTVYYGDINSACTGLTIGVLQYLSASTPGKPTATAPTLAGHIVQQLGTSQSATAMLVEIQPPIELA